MIDKRFCGLFCLYGCMCLRYIYSEYINILYFLSCYGFCKYRFKYFSVVRYSMYFNFRYKFLRDIIMEVKVRNVLWF